tara:strand:+ start:342 stop:1223 length:882 start_codon:yes stop_codon:yes gene_type:complete
MKNSVIYPWFLLILLSIIWGSSPILIKKSLSTLTPFEIGALRISSAAIFLSPFFFKVLNQINKSNFFLLLLSGVIGNLIPYFLYPLAQTEIDSSTSGVLTSLTPFFALLIGGVFYKQKIYKNNITGLIIGFIGTFCLIFFSTENNSINANLYGLLVVLATLFYGINLNLLKYHLVKLDPLTITSTSLFFISPITIWLLISETTFLSNLDKLSDNINEIFYVLILGIIGTAIATIIFYRLVQIRDTVFASSVTYLMPIVAIFLGLIDGEIINLTQFFGMFLILIGVYWANKKSK